MRASFSLKTKVSAMWCVCKEWIGRSGTPSCPILCRGSKRPSPDRKRYVENCECQRFGQLLLPHNEKCTYNRCGVSGRVMRVTKIPTARNAPGLRRPSCEFRLKSAGVACRIRWFWRVLWNLWHVMPQVPVLSVVDQNQKTAGTRFPSIVTQHRS